MRTVQLCVWFIFSAIFSFQVSAQTGPVGALTGQASRDASGGLNYSVPITVPVGTAGMQPQLSFSYNSQNISSDGMLGFGWDIQGANSRITRCAKTVLEDTVADPVDFDGNDQLCLNGSRLVAILGIYGVDGTEYRTRNDSFSKIISYGVSGSGTSAFPAYFKVWTKEGNILEFGNSNDSRVEQQGRTDGAVIQWTINKIADRYNNYMEYKYIENTTNGSYLLDQINYTGNTTAAILPQQQVKFTYETSNGSSNGYFAGGLLTNTQRLKQVTTLSNSAVLYTYNITYLPIYYSNNSAYALVKAIQQCSNGQCFYPIEFSWDQNPYSFSMVNGQYDIKKSTISSLREGAPNNPTLFGDINNDGFTDTVWADLAWKATYPQVKISTGLGKGDGTYYAGTLQQTMPVPAGIWNENTYLVDGDGDSQADIIYISSATPTGATSYNKKFSIYFSKSLGDGTFMPFTTGVYQDVDLSPSATDWRNFIADINGDGLVDGLWVRSYGSGLTTCFTLNKGGGTFDQTIKCNTVKDKIYSSSEWVDIIDDVNKDGYIDIVVAKSTDGLYATAYLGKGDGTFTYAGMSSLKLSGYSNAEWKELMGDINGDGFSDLVWVKSDSTGLQAEIAYSKGDGTFVKANFSTLTLSTADFSGDLISDRIGDVNGDGRADLVWLRSSGVGLQAAVAVNNGNGSYFEQPTLTTFVSGFFDDAGITQNGIYTTYSAVDDIVADVTGDGVADIVFGYHGVGDMVTNRPTGLLTYVLKSPAKLPKITKIQDALGNTTEASYSPMTDYKVYDRDAYSAYPVGESVFAFQYLLSELKTSNGVGGLNVTQFKYKGKKTDFRGADLGFNEVTTTNVSSGLHTVENYSQDYADKKQGTLIRSRVYAADNILISDTNNVWETNYLNNNATYYSYIKSSSVMNCDIGIVNAGICNSSNAISKKTTTNTFDSFGNLINEAVVNSDNLRTYIQNTANEYSNDAGNWIIGKLTSSITTGQAPNQPDITRSLAFGYNNAGSLSDSIIEPNNGQFWRKKHYDYNSFGEILSTTESWPDNTDQLSFNSITNTDTVDTSGRFKKSSTNALNQTQSFEYDEVKGTLLSATDANGLQTSWVSDGFGRQIKEIKADGSITTTEYAWCDPFANACPANGVYSITRRTCAAGAGVCDASTPSDKAVAPTVEYYDSLNRLIRKKIPGMYAANIIFQDTQYDVLGRVAKTSVPYYVNNGVADSIYWVTNEYDKLDRQTKITNADNSFKIINYTGLLTTVTNELNQVNKYTKNALGQLMSVDDNANGKLSYSYDAMGNLVQTKDAQNNITTMNYDLLGNKISMTDPDLGYWQYDYNGLGLLAKQTDNKGVISKTNYDALGRMTSRVDDVNAVMGTAQTSTWSYDTQPKGVGKLAEVRSPGFTQTSSYDVLGRPSSTVSSVNAGGATGTYTFSNSYDDFSRVLATTYPTGYTVTNKWNAQGYLEEVRGPNNIPLKQVGSVDVFGKEDDVFFGNGVENITGTDKKTGRMTSLHTRFGGADLINQSYLFDTIGNLKQRKDTKQNTQEDFLYDGLNRLTSAKSIKTNVSQVISTVTVDYDSIGNIKYKSDVGNYSYGASCGANNIAGPHGVSNIIGIKTANYCYDKNGNLTSGDSRTISYSPFNKPAVIDKGSNRVAMYYDANYQLLVRKDTVNGNVSTTTMLGNYEKVESATGVSHKLYVGDFAIVTQVTGKADKINYLHKDHLDSVVGISDQAGTLVESFSFDAWGKRRHIDVTAAINDIDYISLTSQLTNKGFTSHNQLDGVGLIHMGGRVYDPTIGRFLSADPYIQAPDNMQSYNRYSYVMNNPLSLTDPTGYFWAEMGAGISNFFSMIGSMFSGIFNSIRNTIRSLMRGVYKTTGPDAANRNMTQNNQNNAANQTANCGGSTTCTQDAAGVGPDSQGTGSNNHDQKCAASASGCGTAEKSLPQNNPDTAGVKGENMKAVSIDFDFIAQFEGGMRTKAYVPDPAGSNSGVTVSVGFDLGERSINDLKGLNLSDDLIDKLQPYLGKQGMAAKEFLDNNPLTISTQEANTIFNNITTKVVNGLVGKYNSDSKVMFGDIPAKWQTVIGSVEYQYGSAKKKSPIFWSATTQQNWNGAIYELRNFDDKYSTRRNKEADYVQNH